jgi:thiol-disulfide isomerase/thioredoxin
MATLTNILIFKGDQNALKQQAISAEGLVIVDFQASWCPSRPSSASSCLGWRTNSRTSCSSRRTSMRQRTCPPPTRSVQSPHLKFLQMLDGQLHELASVTGVNIPRIRKCLRIRKREYHTQLSSLDCRDDKRAKRRRRGMELDIVNEVSDSMVP